MALRKYKPSMDTSSVSMAPLDFPKKALKTNALEPEMAAGLPVEADVDIDLREVYFLIMHFLSVGPCKQTYGQLWNELLEHQLLPRRYHAWYSRSGACSGNEDDDGMSLPLCYLKLVERYHHIEKDHLIKLLKQLILNCSPQHGVIGGSTPNAADVPTLLGTGSFSLLGSSRDEDRRANHLPGYLRWPHMQADQVHGLSLREIGGGFTKHHRAPSVRAACYAIAKPSTLVQKMQIIKKLRGHQNAVYCAIFDRSGRYVITGSDDRLVKIWSMETAFCLASCRGHEGDITDLAVSSNNALVASSSNDFIIRVWRLPDGLPISVLRGHTGAVTAIAFSPRPSAIFQLLSSSDDGTCRIWDARYSQMSLRIYVPKPLDVVPGKVTDPASTTTQRTHQILCCAYNANGTVFVTGSSDTFARVWNACKSNAEDSEQPTHEMDLLSGHENDVNYVQFSGCAVASRSSTADNLKEDNLPKFKNSWFTHDNIVTCSRDGSAIIWIPRSRRHHGKVGRWTRAYHLKVPPPPMAPQPSRGGPRQRFQPTPRGVNMIVWSLDNRFVLAAIMDCRICVWNASDGSLVHSLIGHTESTFVLDVHPFNPRIAMSAGYDGKTIIWDIWEGTPVRIYETGRFRLVDGKFSPDGTSIILSDEVGQVFIIATGQGESQKDAKYDQFFLGDYRPLIQDTHGNFLDQETQLAPYRRNIQDLLCDSSMIPYPDPYQNMYQQRRLGILGIEWRPPAVKFAVGPTYNVNSGDFQMLPIIDLDWWVEPMPEFVDTIDWEQENEVQSDDTDSEYNVADECSSEGEHVSLSDSSSGYPECSGDEGGIDHASKESLRRSRRKKHKSNVAITTSSGRRVKRRNLDERDGTASRTHRTRRSKNGQTKSKRKSSSSKSSRPQRRAARNALSLFSKINGVSSDGEDEDESETTPSESDSVLAESNTHSNDSDRSMQTSPIKHERGKEAARDEFENAVKPSLPSQSLANVGNKRKLVLKLPRRDSKAAVSSEITKIEGNGHAGVGTSDAANADAAQPSITFDGISSQDGTSGKTRETVQHNLSVGCDNSTIKWGEVKMRSAKRLRTGDVSVTDAWLAANTRKDDGPNITASNFNEQSRLDGECGTSSNSENQVCRALDRKGYGKEVHFQGSSSHGLDDARSKAISPERYLALQNSSWNIDQGDQSTSAAISEGGTELLVPMDEKSQGSPQDTDCRGIDGLSMRSRMIMDNRASTFSIRNGENHIQDVGEVPLPTYRRLRIKTRGLASEARSSPKFHSTAVDDWRSSGCDLISAGGKQHGKNSISIAHENEDVDERSPVQDELDNGSGSLEIQEEESGGHAISLDLQKSHLDSNDKMYNAVYRRSKTSRIRKTSESDGHGMEESTSNSNSHCGNLKMDIGGTVADGVCRTRSMSLRVTGDELNPAVNISTRKEVYSFANGRRNASNEHDQLLSDEWMSTSKLTVGLRSARNRRENYNRNELRPFNKWRNQQPARKLSWLMLLEHEESYRYIPQQGDEVAYLRQGHEEYIKNYRSSEQVPWKLLKGSLRAVEFCKVQELDYSTLPGSGESCCKLILKFIDPECCGFQRTFKLTLPELVAFPDFLVERTRFQAAIDRNWTHRDKCQVWWRNEDEDGGSWWEGRILQVKPKSSEYPDSPWERYVIQYRNDGSGQHLHSPWELHDADSQWEHPHIDDEIKKKLLAALARLERSSSKEDVYGVQKLSQVAQKSDFLNRFPVPLSLAVITARLENNYYRNLEAVKHDASVMLSNAESYLSKSRDMTKIELLSKRITGIFSKL